MDNNKIIIIVLIAIIAALLVGIFAMMPNMSKQDTKLTFESNATLTEGDSIKIKLTDANGTAIANQTVNVTITDKNNTSDYHSVVTDGDGVGKLKLDKNSGKYNVTISYGGNDNFTGCNATQKLTIKEKEKVVEAQTSSSSSSASSSSSESSSSSGYDINNLPPSKDPYPETARYYAGENYVMQEYADGYVRTVDIRTGEVYSNGFR
ncbi:MAG: carboxypeptidase regulatory-like domain-containing protein [Methanobrevibacter sp.]|uniref:Ig-like domain-containing protein n=1 Tax=Methanobrevibacter sp. TaxID=66852 RepID=UPI0025CFA5A1|nr:Ig-like domain-containing protein [Methanobrevibacter sp.]MBE6508099.1 carboxypeptidase regulatory-like domain-containing protein [Methanobrevibacter sp.]